VKKYAVESYRLLIEAYGEAALSETTCREWFRRSKSGDFDVEDKERAGRPKLVKNTKLKKHYSKKIHVKRKKNLQNHWELLNPLFLYV